MRRTLTFLVVLALVSGLLSTGCPLLRRAPALSVSPTTLRFDRDDPDTQTFQVWNSGASGTTLNFTVEVVNAETTPWINVNPSSGRSTGPTNKVPIDVTITRDAAAKAAFSTASIMVRSTRPVASKTVSVTAAPDYFTEQFSATNAFDLSGLALVLTPDETVNYYGAVVADLDGELPTNPAGAQEVDFTADDPYEVDLDPNAVSLYGESYDSLFICTNGSVAFEAVDPTVNTPSLTAHFSAPRVSGLLANLAPDEGGTVTFQLNDAADGVAVTYQGVPGAGTANLATFQIELFFDGTIQLSYLDNGVVESIVGLSSGEGLPADFVASDLSGYNTGPLRTTP